MNSMNQIVRYGALARDVTNKNAGIMMYVNYMLARTARMFRYTNLPEHIGERELELIIQSYGCAGIARAPGNTDLYAMYGAPGGAPDAYLRPTKFVYANPALGSKVYDLNQDGPDMEIVLIPNDSLYQGLMPMFERYATLLAENDISIAMAEVNNRLVSVIKADTDADKIAADKFINDIKAGKLSAILQQPMIDGLSSGIEVNSFSSSATVNYMTQLIELQQYLKASWYNDLGLNANYNMKREAINSAEAALGQDTLVPLCEDMLRCRQEALDKINELFGTDISVEFDSVWAQNDEERDIELDSMESESMPDDSAISLSTDSNESDSDIPPESDPEESEESEDNNPDSESSPDSDDGEEESSPESEEEPEEASEPETTEEAIQEVIEEAVEEVIDILTEEPEAEAEDEPEEKEEDDDEQDD